MTALKSTGELRVRPDGTTAVTARIHLDGSAWFQCCVYPDRAPVVSLISGPADISVGVPDCHHVTADDLAHARQLAATVAEYVADLERWVVAQDQAPDSTGKAA